MAASVPASDPAVEGIMKQREMEIRKAARNYEAMLLQADGKALKQLSALLKNRLQSKDPDALRSVRKAIARIEESPEPSVSVPDSARKQKIDKSNSPVSDYPDGTFAQFGRHFYIFPVRMNCDDAKNACSVMGGSLLKINNEEEFNYFVKRAGSGKKAFWIDMVYSKSENKWLGGKDGKNPFTRWRKGYPVAAADAGSVLVDCRAPEGDMINIPGSRTAETVICEWDK